MDTSVPGSIPVERLTGYVDAWYSIVATLAQAHLSALATDDTDLHASCTQQCAHLPRDARESCLWKCSEVDVLLANKVVGVVSSILVFVAVGLEWREHATTLLHVRHLPRRTVLVDLFLLLPAISFLPFAVAIAAAFFSEPSGVLTLFLGFLVLGICRSIHAASLAHVSGSGAQLLACRAMGLGGGKWGDGSEEAESVKASVAQRAVWFLAGLDIVVEFFNFIICFIISRLSARFSTATSILVFVVLYRLRVILSHQIAFRFCRNCLCFNSPIAQQHLHAIGGDSDGGDGDGGDDDGGDDDVLTVDMIWGHVEDEDGGDGGGRSGDDGDGDGDDDDGSGERRRRRRWRRKRVGDYARGRQRRRYADVSIGRIAGFADGVFTISATLILLNIHTPTLSRIAYDGHTIHSPGGGADDVEAYLEEWKPSVIAAVLSVVVIGTLWATHAQTLSIAGSHGFLQAYSIGFIAHTILLSLLGLLPVSLSLVTSLPGLYIGQFILGIVVSIISCCFLLVILAILVAIRRSNASSHSTTPPSLAPSQSQPLMEGSGFQPLDIASSSSSPTALSSPLHGEGEDAVTRVRTFGSSQQQQQHIQNAALFISLRLLLLIAAGIALTILAKLDDVSIELVIAVLGPAVALLLVSHGYHAVHDITPTKSHTLRARSSRIQTF